MLGFQMEWPRFTAFGRRTGWLQPEPTRSTRQRFETTPGMGWPSTGLTVAGVAGRVDWKTMNVPSGDMAGDESGHSPEKDARTGLVHWPSTLCDSRITVQLAVERVK